MTSVVVPASLLLLDFFATNLMPVMKKDDHRQFNESSPTYSIARAPRVNQL